MTIKDEIVELKPCPFCGDNKAYCSPADDSGEVVFVVACQSCGVEMVKQFEAAAIEQWNTRAAIMPGETRVGILPCPVPWCAREADVDWFDVGVQQHPYWVRCSKCGCKTPTQYATAREAIEAWNTRPTPTAPDDGELVERVARAIEEVLWCQLGEHRLEVVKTALAACHHPELVEAATLAFDCLLVGDPEREHARTAEALRKLKKVLAKIGGEHVSHNRR